MTLGPAYGNDGGGDAVVFSGARLARTSNQTISNSLDTNINWQSEAFDDGGWADLVTDDTIFTVPAGVTRVALSAGATFASNATGIRSLFIMKGGVQVARVRLDAASQGPTVLEASTGVIDVAEDDTFKVRVFQSSGGNLDVEFAFNTFFTVNEVK